MKRSLILSLCLAAVFALCLCSCGSNSSGSSSASGSESASASASKASSAESSSQAAESESSESSAAESGESKASEAATEEAAEAPGFDFVEECTDEFGNITLYALAELKGWQTATLLDQQGYEFDKKDNVWLRPDGASFLAYREAGPYTIDTYNEMNEKGGAIAAVGFNIVTGYPDGETALNGCAKCVVEDSFFDGGEGIAIFYGPSMKEYLAIVTPIGDGAVQFMIFSQEAVGSGMLDQMMGEPAGGTFKDVWKYTTGKDSYGH